MIKAYRKDRGVSLRDLAKEVGIHYSKLHRIENDGLCDLESCAKLIASPHHEKEKNNK